MIMNSKVNVVLYTGVVIIETPFKYGAIFD